MFKKTKEEKKIFNKKMYAFYVDYLIALTINFGIYFSLLSFFEDILFSSGDSVLRITKMISLNATNWGMVSIIFAYYCVFPYLNNGKTIGYEIFGITTKTQNKEDLPFLHFLGRSLTFSLTLVFAPYLLLYPLFNKKSKTIYDRIFKIEIIEEKDLVIKEDITTNLTLLNSLYSSDGHYFLDETLEDSISSKKAS